jgi:hypothetical protein
MTTQFCSEMAADLVRQAREDDERMTPGEWLAGHHDEGSYVSSGTMFGGRQVCTLSYNRNPRDHEDSEAIARTRNNLRAMADQLEAAMVALEEREHDMHMRIRAGYDSAVATAWRQRLAETESHLAAARAEVVRMKPVYEAAMLREAAVALGDDAKFRAADKALTRAIQAALSTATKEQP